jgi:hypothetical protein
MNVSMSIKKVIQTFITILGNALLKALSKFNPRLKQNSINKSKPNQAIKLERVM